MSGTRVATMSAAVDGPQQQSEDEDTDDDRDAELLTLALHLRRCHDAGESHHRADREVDPPLMTQMAWATAAKASGSTEMAKPWKPVTP